MITVDNSTALLSYFNAFGHGGSLFQIFLIFLPQGKQTVELFCTEHFYFISLRKGMSDDVVLQGVGAV